MKRCDLGCVCVVGLGLLGGQSVFGAWEESFSTGLPTRSQTVPAEDGITLSLGSGDWYVKNNSDPIGTTSVFSLASVYDPFSFFMFPHSQPDALAMFYLASDSAGTVDLWVVSPELTLVNGAQLAFYASPYVAFLNDRLEVRASLSGDSLDVGTSVGQVGDFDQVLTAINPDAAPGGFPAGWLPYGSTITGLDRPHQGRIAFRYFTPSANFIAIDTLSFAVPGDFDSDGNLTVGDIDLLRDEIMASSSNPAFDLTGDSVVDVDDLIYWVEGIHATRLGDANLDGKVDDTDLAAVQASLGMSGSGWADGNFSLDTRVTLYDAYLLFKNYGYDWDAPAATVAPIPEPASLVMLALGGLLVAHRRR